MAKPKQFRATLERMTENRLGWTIIYLPFDVAKVWGTRGQVKVRGAVNGFPFRTSAFPTKRGVHFMMVNKQMQRGAKTAPGMSANFRMEPDLEVRVVAEPKELLRALQEDKKLERWFRSKLNYSARRDIAKWVGDVKQAATRERRAEQMAERLYSTMEAEIELPPIIQRAMDATPKAFAGWKKMTPTMRRGELLGIFYYRNPAAQQRRIQRAIERMLERAEK
ncbi:MAG: YdeI/OmpD-associated family protein [Terriglobales bacterium]